MADSKITALTALTAADPANDMIPIVDVSDTPPASGNTKRISINNLLACSPSATLASATISGDLTVRTDKLKVDASGVGVNTTSTTLGGGVMAIEHASNNGLVINSTAGSPTLYLRNVADSNLAKLLFTDNGLTFDTANGGTRMTLNATGLGVGTSPAYKFQVRTTSDGVCQFMQRGGGTNNPYFRVLFTDATATTTIDASSGAGNPILTLATGGSDRLIIDSSGNVGIGVTPTTIVGASGANGKGLQGDSWTISSLGGTNDSYFGNNLYTSAYGVWSNRVNAASGAYYISGGTHIFYRGAAQAAGTITPTESARIDASGNLLVGTTSLIFGSVSNSLNIAAANTQQFIIRHTGATAGEFWRQAVDTANTFYILNNATAGVSITSGATSWSAVSDERLKDIIEPISNAIAKIGSLRSVIGKYKNDETNIRRSFLIAQDVQSVLPEAVDSSKPNELGLRYTEVIPLLVAAIQELTAEVNALKNA